MHADTCTVSVIRAVEELLGLLCSFGCYVFLISTALFNVGTDTDDTGPGSSRHGADIRVSVSLRLSCAASLVQCRLPV